MSMNKTLKRHTVNSAKDLVEVAARCGRVGECKADLLLGVDDEDSADGERETLLVDVRQILVVQHVVERRDLTVSVRDLARGSVQIWNKIDGVGVRSGTEHRSCPTR